MLKLPAPPADYDLRVFINCPFDKRFKPIFDAIVFAIQDLGFQARHALIDDANAVRLERIIEEMACCRFSLHDISRVQVGSNRLPRFNMPFEAGIGYSLHALQPQQREHHFGLLDAYAHQHNASVSDLAGLDPNSHGNDPLRAIDCVRYFLRGKPQVRDLPGAALVRRRYQAFQRLLGRSARVNRLTLGELKQWSYANDMQRLMIDWIADNPT